ncbi:uncharacterized protein LAESUDRAFT_748815 [Laetiporus sulphureus 93-53]|uniref:Uncharacterized protein n=1 Tax=Laetiporus sulphureus 93-53 TaxID=1314785 RepID=A0A165FCM9_9APHY|nr:uncharacterized protein LAESUDRAFT_748815 [Laetiporus sulphureus 93-53]KZT08766.1 hypothetical protein LAESUDRAFT_748815 [Laetiporus sulphureus 93-53]
MTAFYDDSSLHQKSLAATTGPIRNTLAFLEFRDVHVPGRGQAMNAHRTRLLEEAAYDKHRPASTARIATILVQLTMSRFRHLVPCLTIRRAGTPEERLPPLWSETTRRVWSSSSATVVGSRSSFVPPPARSVHLLPAAIVRPDAVMQLLDVGMPQASSKLMAGVRIHYIGAWWGITADPIPVTWGHMRVSVEALPQGLTVEKCARRGLRFLFKEVIVSET